jgi:hypothetical protein
MSEDAGVVPLTTRMIQEKISGAHSGDVEAHVARLAAMCDQSR